MTMEELRRLLSEKMRASCPGLGAVAISDRDGCVLLKCVLENNPQLDAAAR